jgi:hypothetical protein
MKLNQRNKSANRTMELDEGPETPMNGSTVNISTVSGL